MLCHRCGAQNPDGALRCASCGEKLAKAPPGRGAADYIRRYPVNGVLAGVSVLPAVAAFVLGVAGRVGRGEENWETEAYSAPSLPDVRRPEASAPVVPPPEASSAPDATASSAPRTAARAAESYDAGQAAVHELVRYRVSGYG